MTDAEFTRLEPLLPPPKGLARHRVRPIREILNAIFYVVRSGCAWRLLPHEFAPWQTAYHYFRLWRLDGTWEHLNTITRRLVEGFAPRRIPAVATTAALSDLTPRELEVLRLMAGRLSNSEIAADLTVSDTTVKTHVARVLMKLGVRDRSRR